MTASCLFRRILRYFCLYWCFLFFKTLTFAQNADKSWNSVGISSEVSFKYGRIFRHNERFLPQITESSSLYECHLLLQTRGNKAWQGAWGYPLIGVGLVHARFGDADVFGNAWGLLPSVTWQHHFRRFALNYRVGIGLAYLSRFYDVVSNPTNNVIGSHLNNITQLSVQAVWELHRQWHLLGSVGLNHFSNARTQLPNLGINLPSAGIGLRYFPKTPQKPPVRRVDLDSLRAAIHFAKQWRLGFKVGLGFSEGQLPLGPKYHIYGTQLHLVRRSSPKWQWLAGIEANYYTGLYYEMRNRWGQKEPRYSDAMKIAPYLGGEMLLGHLSFSITTGYYIHNPLFNKIPVATKIGLHYYAKSNMFNQRNNWWVGVSLKTHYAVADYAEIGLGYLW